MRKLKSFAIVFGAAVVAAVLTSLVDKQLGFVVFFGVAASMGVGEVMEHRRLRKVAAHLDKSENTLTEVMQTMQASLAAAELTGDPTLIQSANRALASAGNLRTNIQSLKADLA